LSSFILVVCLAGVFSLAPFSMSLLWLAVLNRRGRPTVVSGAWDFAALVAGLSGFVLFGGGLLLTLLQSNARFLMRGNFEALRNAWGQEHLTWVTLVALYLVVVVGGAALTFAARRRSLAVYNVDPGQFEVTLAEIFDHVGRPAERRGNLWSAGVALCDLDPFPAGRAVTLRWLSDDLRLFQEVERHLRDAAPSLGGGGEGPPARWCMSGAIGSLSIVVFCVVVLVFTYARLG